MFMLKQNPNAANPTPALPEAKAPSANIRDVKLSSPPNYKVGDTLATRYAISCNKHMSAVLLHYHGYYRQAYGTALVKIAENNDRVVALDGDMKNSTFSQNLRKKFPERHVECFICEQNMAGVRYFLLYLYCTTYYYKIYVIVFHDAH
jgi:transketolase